MLGMMIRRTASQAHCRFRSSSSGWVPVAVVEGPALVRCHQSRMSSLLLLPSSAVLDPCMLVVGHLTSHLHPPQWRRELVMKT